MSKDQVIDLLQQYRLSFDAFLEYMRNKTYSRYADGTADYPRQNVKEFITQQIFQK